jgi:hypothetical protein
MGMEKTIHVDQIGQPCFICLQAQSNLLHRLHRLHRIFFALKVVMYYSTQ